MILISDNYGALNSMYNIAIKDQTIANRLRNKRSIQKWENLKRRVCRNTNYFHWLQGIAIYISMNRIACALIIIYFRIIPIHPIIPSSGLGRLVLVLALLLSKNVNLLFIFKQENELSLDMINNVFTLHSIA